MAGQRAKRGEVSAVSEDVARGCLLCVGEELKLVLLGLRHEVTAWRTWRRPRGARRARARAGARHTQPAHMHACLKLQLLSGETTQYLRCIYFFQGGSVAEWLVC